MDIGAIRHRVTLKNSSPVPDGDGGFTEVLTTLTPATVWASIAPATARDLERVVAGTVESAATHLVRVRYHPGITTKTRLLYGSRMLNVTSVQNTDERKIELVLVCEEVVA